VPASAVRPGATGTLVGKLPSQHVHVLTYGPGRVPHGRGWSPRL